jgi:hypothetical protein
MNRTLQKVGRAAMEVRKEIIHMVWDMLGEGGLHPKKCKPNHLLRSHYFLKFYPSEGPGCSTVSGLKGAVDPKAMRKWVWRMLKRIPELADHVVSPFLFRKLAQHCLTLLHCLPLSQNHRLCSKANSNTTLETTV